MIFQKKLSYALILVIVLGVFSCTIHEEVRPVPSSKPARIALVLGAGAYKGFAHVGVIKILESNKIPIHMIVGTSAGSAVGCLYAYGYDAFALQKIAFAIEKDTIVDYDLIPSNGFIKGEKLEAFINQLVHNTPIQKLKIPFYAVATDIESGQETVFVKGNTGIAVRASCSIPGVFRPTRISNKLYVDGGVVSPVAVEAAKKLGADVVIAVDISSSIDIRQPEGTVDTLMQSINIMYSKLSIAQLGQADVVIKPKVGYIGSADVSKKHEAILEGEKAALAVLPQLQEIVARLKAEGRLQ